MEIWMGPPIHATIHIEFYFLFSQKQYLLFISNIRSA
jgi:hypothetical protein